MNFRQPPIIEHLAFLSVKYSVYLAELYQAILSARAEGKSVCEALSIEYRGTVQKEAIFLITEGAKVVVQFRIPENFLSRENVSLDGAMDTDKIRRQISRQNPAPDHSTLIQDLRYGMTKVNVEAEILEAQKPQLIHTQFGNSVWLTNAVISDKTGKVKLCLWGEQSYSAVVGDFVQIKNARVRTFKGERQLSVGKMGTISVLQNKNEEHETVIAAS